MFGCQFDKFKFMKFPDEMFEGMKFPVHGLDKDTDLIEKFPELTRHDEFNKAYLQFSNANMSYDRNMLLRYIFYCYDVSIAWDLPDMKTRKEEAMKLAGYRIDSTRREPIVEMLLSNEIIDVNEMIIAFFKIQNNRKHRWRMQALDLLDQYDRIIMEPIDPELDDDKRLKSAGLKTKLMDDTWKFGEELDVIEAKYFGSEDEAKVILTTTKKRISPESVDD